MEQREIPPLVSILFGLFLIFTSWITWDVVTVSSVVYETNLIQYIKLSMQYDLNYILYLMTMITIIICGIIGVLGGIITLKNKPGYLLCIFSGAFSLYPSFYYLIWTLMNPDVMAGIGLIFAILSSIILVIMGFVQFGLERGFNLQNISLQDLEEQKRKNLEEELMMTKQRQAKIERELTPHLKEKEEKEEKIP